MRPLFLTEERITFDEPMVRGGAIHVRNVVEGLRERGHDASLIDWNPSPDRAYQFSIDPRTRFVEGPLRTAKRAVEVGRERTVDAIVSKTRKTYLPGLLAARILGVPHVAHVGSSLQRPDEGPVDRLDGMSLAARLRAPHDGYFVVCAYIADQLSDRGVARSRVFDVRNAVDTERFHPERVPVELDHRFHDQLADLEDSTFRIGFVGGLQPYKGLDDLAAALTQLDVEAVAVIAGDGPERGRIRDRFGESGLLLGPVPYEQVPALYHEFDVFVLPSRTEGLPRVILEAQATGTPAVATRVGGVPEIVDHERTGLLCDVASPSSLANAIRRLETEPSTRETLASRGRESVESGYTWTGMYDRYEQFLGEILE